MSFESRSPEIEDNGQATENSFFERLRHNTKARNLLIGTVALGAVGFGVKSYFDASHNSKVDVAQLSDRIEAGVLESFGEPDGVEVFDRNVILTEGATFYDAPHEVIDRRLGGLVRNSNVVETLDADQVRSAETVLTINGEGGKTWLGVRPENNSPEAADEAEEVDAGEEEQATNDADIAKFALGELVWTPVDVSEESGLPTAYFANTDESVSQISVDSISVSADMVTATGSEASNLAASTDLSLPFADVLAFNNAFYGEGITGGFLPMDMAELPNTAHAPTAD